MKSRVLVTSLFVAVVVGGCAAPLPVSFQLVDSVSKLQPGTIFTDTQRIEVTIDGKVFNGFYIVATGTAVSHSQWGRRFYPSDTVTTYSLNSARAQLTADNGQRLTCEFLFEAKRALGECKYPDGKTFQMIADGN